MIAKSERGPVIYYRRVKTEYKNEVRLKRYSLTTVESNTFWGGIKYYVIGDSSGWVGDSKIGERTSDIL